MKTIDTLPTPGALRAVATYCAAHPAVPAQFRAELAEIIDRVSGLAELLAAAKDLVGEDDLGEMDMEPEELDKLERTRAAIARVEGLA